MNTLFYTPHHVSVLPPAVYAIGNFDGLHLGHQSLFARARSLAHKHNLPWGVLTFEPHPRAVLSNAPQRLTPFSHKMSFLKDLGAAQVAVVPFDRTFAQTPPSVFVDHVIKRFCQAQHILVGQEFCFGPQRSATFMDLQTLCAHHNILVESAPLVLDETGQVISSKRIVAALHAGHMLDAKRMLGRPYTVTGLVIRGDQRGRELGFPTANLLANHYILPQHGVYAVTVFLKGKSYQGMAYVGTRPTFASTKERLEVHIFDFNQTIYGHTLDIQFGPFIRAEEKFETVSLLVTQIHKDFTAAKRIFDVTNNH